jgi:hypothetical protein
MLQEDMTRERRDKEMRREKGEATGRSAECKSLKIVRCLRFVMRGATVTDERVDMETRNREWKGKTNLG